MAHIQASAERRVNATADRVYELLADYRNSRPRILPANYSEYRIEEGGTGEGTLVRYRFKAGPRERDYRMRVVEAQPGRLLRERDEESTLQTTWTLTAAATATQVRVETTWEGGSGMGGFFERLFAPRALSKVHTETLESLQEALARGASAS